MTTLAGFSLYLFFLWAPSSQCDNECYSYQHQYDWCPTVNGECDLRE